MTRTLSQCYYGDEENDFKPIKEFINLMNSEEYSELWKVAQKIEGLICRIGVHAGGVIFVDEPFTNSTALMKAPDGTIITQFDLHDAEDVSLIKYDALSVEAMDKIQICIELLQNHGYIKKELSLKEAYEQTVGIYGLERKNKQMWKMVWNHEILSLFQMEQQSGVQGISLTHPESVDDMTVLNSAIRLMAQDKNSDSPLEKFAKFKKDISLWYDEMNRYGITSQEQKILEKVVKISYGLCIAQEQFMQLVQLPECGGFSLTWADKLRKSIAKKNPKAYNELEKEFFKVTKEKGCSEKLCNYVWKVLIAMNRGYGFNQSHTLAYSLIGLQEMNLAFKYPIIFWNTANLIVNSGSLEVEENESNKDKATDYSKVAKAIGDIISRGIKVSLIDINKSSYSFEPDTENNEILFGMKALNGVGSDIINQIIANRPYYGIADFMNKCPLNKTAMISLIKAGAFDKLEQDWGKELNKEPRLLVMAYYLSKASEPKKKLTLQNFNGLIQKNLIPSELDFQKRTFLFNKYLKANKKVGKYYVFDEICDKFYNEYFDLDKLDVVNGLTCILQTKWDKIYQDSMDAARDWLRNNQTKMLTEYNQVLFKEAWDKYAAGNISSWEMDSLCFYYHEHELKDVNIKKYGIDNFFDLSPSSEVDYFFKRNGKEIPIYVIHRIIGTVIGKNDARSSITLLTTSGVVNVKFTKEYYAMAARQISELGEDGVKHTIEKSWFTRGTKLFIQGFRRDDTFVAKTYSRTVPEHQLYKISKIENDGTLELQYERKNNEGEEI